MMVYVSLDALNSISKEVEISKNTETGGILLGKLLQNGDVLITHAIGPGPNSIRKQYEFRKDFDYSVRMLEILYSRYSVDFLGDWHKHPTGCVNYSNRDHKSMIRIATINKKRCYFIIVGDEYNQINTNIALYSIEADQSTVNKIPFTIVEKPEEIAQTIGFIE